MTENIIMCGYLGICSCYDCKSRRIPLWLLYVGILLGTAYAGLMFLSGRLTWQAILTGLVPGGIMLLYSHLTEGKLGGGDGLMVIFAGLFWQWESCTAAVLVACFLTFWAALLLILSGKGHRNTQLPFAPFLLAGIVIVWIIQSFSGDVCA